uniref:Uncharacterized protein n=1 Tax=Eutreptiella gymnastica TaxID=73025 RepID=A0A7S1JGP5_9EUGL
MFDVSNQEQESLRSSYDSDTPPRLPWLDGVHNEEVNVAPDNSPIPIESALPPVVLPPPARCGRRRGVSACTRLAWLCSWCTRRQGTC